MISLKDMVNEQVDEWGIDVLLVVSSKKVPCKCFNHNTNEGKYNCKICLGAGSVTAIQKRKAIIDSVNVKFGNLTNEMIGQLDPTQLSMYIKSNTSVSVADKVILVGWKQSQIQDVKEIFLIESVFEHRMDNGRIEGFTTVIKRCNETMGKYKNYINHLPRSIKAKIEKGDTFICPS